jgi:hypothetical protein
MLLPPEPEAGEPLVGGRLASGAQGRIDPRLSQAHDLLHKYTVA